MNTRSPRFAAGVAVLLALSLAACGGDDSEEPATASSDEPQATATATATVEEGGESAASGAGDTLPLGERAEVPYVDYGGDPNKKTRVGVSVVKVRKGKMADFKGFNLDSKQRKSVPYYVDTKFENVGDFGLVRNAMDPSIEDADGQEYRAMILTVIGGTFKPCPQASDKKLAPGDSFTTCSAFLLPIGKELERVRFLGDPVEDPVFWQPA